MKVLITIDTEAYPLLPSWLQDRLTEDISRDIYGGTPCGRFGLGYQLQMLNEHGLRGVFFVETLFTLSVGLEPLRRIVGEIQECGHEVQLHAHTEWLEYAQGVHSHGNGYNIRDFNEKKQQEIIELARDRLCASGAMNASAFRAGNFGANVGTLRALSRCGIPFDSSHNVCYLHDDLDLANGGGVLQPLLAHGVYEFPVSFARDALGRNRHAQLTACSSGELQSMLFQAWERQWEYFVVVLHSFELLMDRRRRLQRLRPDWFAVKRFRKMCEFLADNRDRFQTTTFGEVNRAALCTPVCAAPLHTGLLHTGRRLCEQAVRQIIRRVLP